MPPLPVSPLPAQQAGWVALLLTKRCVLHLPRAVYELAQARQDTPGAYIVCTTPGGVVLRFTQQEWREGVRVGKAWTRATRQAARERRQQARAQAAWLLALSHAAETQR